MKAFVLAVLAFGLSISAMALSPDQVGSYTGTIQRSVSDYNTKKPVTEQDSAILNINGDGSAELISSFDHIVGTIGLGAYRGILSVSAESSNKSPRISTITNYSVTVKGTKLTLKPSVNVPSNLDNGTIIEFDIKLKKNNNPK